MAERSRTRTSDPFQAKKMEETLWAVIVFCIVSERTTHERRILDRYSVSLDGKGPIRFILDAWAFHIESLWHLRSLSRLPLLCKYPRVGANRGNSTPLSRRSAVITSAVYKITGATCGHRLSRRHDKLPPSLPLKRKLVSAKDDALYPAKSLVGNHQLVWSLYPAFVCGSLLFIHF